MLHADVLAVAEKTWVHDNVYFVDGFLSHDDCLELRDELSICFWQPSPTYQRQPDGRFQNRLTDFRVSETAYQNLFPDELNEKIDAIEQRLPSIVPVDVRYLEEWQATRYPVDGRFDYHVDAGYWEDHPAGDRITTFLVYLDTPLRGGETHFRALDVSIAAIAGRLLVWDNLFPSGHCNYQMIHSGTPVIQGTKTTLVTWRRQKPFRNPRGESPCNA